VVAGTINGEDGSFLFEHTWTGGESKPSGVHLLTYAPDRQGGLSIVVGEVREHGAAWIVLSREQAIDCEA